MGRGTREESWKGRNHGLQSKEEGVSLKSMKHPHLHPQNCSVITAIIQQGTKQFPKTEDPFKTQPASAWQIWLSSHSMFYILIEIQEEWIQTRREGKWSL